MEKKKLTKPARLCVKRHRVTGLLYFCFSTKTFIEGYKGSGVDWSKHLRKNGFDIETIWVSRWFQPEEETKIRRFAKLFSYIADIGNSPKWANKIDEEGVPNDPSKAYLACDSESYVKMVESRRKTNPDYNDQKGQKNPFWKGWYITPWGTFDSVKEAVEHKDSNGIKRGSVYAYCLDNKKPLSAKRLRQTAYNGFSNSDVGKTLEELGFGFIPKSQDDSKLDC